MRSGRYRYNPDTDTAELISLSPAQDSAPASVPDPQPITTPEPEPDTAVPGWPTDDEDN